GGGRHTRSDNNTPRHPPKIRPQWNEVTPAVKSAEIEMMSSHNAPRPHLSLPKAPARPEPAGISAQTLAARIDSFLESRGYRAPADKEEHGRNMQLGPSADTPAAFVCEDDVRAAMKAGRKVLIDDKTIVTPAARDLGEA